MNRKGGTSVPPKETHLVAFHLRGLLAQAFAKCEQPRSRLAPFIRPTRRQSHSSVELYVIPSAAKNPPLTIRRQPAAHTEKCKPSAFRQGTASAVPKRNASRHLPLAPPSAQAFVKSNHASASHHLPATSNLAHIALPSPHIPASRRLPHRLYFSSVSKITFGTDGWRAIIAEDFTFDNVRTVVHAITRYVVRAEKPGAEILVGYDTRFGSERFARAAAETIAAAGVPVSLSAEAAPTPALSLLVTLRQAAGGIQITASHNPFQWNGVKYKASYGSSASPAIVSQIETELARVLRDGVPALPPQPNRIQSLDVRAPYLETLAGLVDWNRIRDSKFRFVVDPMHGAGRGLLVELFRRNGVPCEEIRGTRDPLFGGVNPEPIEPHVAALRQAVTAGKYDAGFALDGDADRIGAIDRDGSFITPHQIFSILLWHLAGTRQLTGEVAKTFSTTKMIDKIAAKFGRKVWETPIGFKYICDRMLEGDILLGGEESGGIGTKLYLPERDASVNALLLAEVMAWHGKHLGELVAMLHQEFGEHHYARVDLTTKDGQKEKALRYFADPQLKSILAWPITRREDLDGIKLYIAEIGWILIRTSGTENMLRVYSETSRPETTRQALDAVVSLVQKM
jgi:alpha-D-glucose phosphate-specific phosphoglucomutase